MPSRSKASLLLLLTCYHCHSNAFIPLSVQRRQTQSHQRTSAAITRNLFVKDLFHLHAQQEDDSSNLEDPKGQRSKINGDVDFEVADEVVSFASDMRTQDEQVNGSIITDLTSDNAAVSVPAPAPASALAPLTAAKSKNTKKTKPGLSSERAAARIERFKKRIRNVTTPSKELLSNVFSAQFGKRGEPYLAVQMLLLSSIALGYAPLLHNFMRVVLGPGMLFTGLGTSLMAVRTMNAPESKAFTLFKQPRSGSSLVDSGLFGFVRHPFYAGNLATLLGWSVTSNSVMRMIFTISYYKLLEKMVLEEEKQMEVAFGEAFSDYKKKVPDKFLPTKALDSFMKSLRESSSKKVKKKDTGGKKEQLKVQMMEKPKRLDAKASKMSDLGFPADDQSSSDASVEDTAAQVKKPEATRKSTKNPNGLFP